MYCLTLANGFALHVFQLYFRHAVLPSHASFTKPQNDPPADYYQQAEPKQAWRPSPSPLLEHRQPLSAMSGELTHRSKMSKKEEMIAQDW